MQTATSRRSRNLWADLVMQEESGSAAARQSDATAHGDVDAALLEDRPVAQLGQSSGTCSSVNQMKGLLILHFVHQR